MSETLLRQQEQRIFLAAGCSDAECSTADSEAVRKIVEWANVDYPPSAALPMIEYLTSKGLATREEIGKASLHELASLLRGAATGDSGDGESFGKDQPETGYLKKELEKELDVSSGTVSNYLKGAGVATPGRGARNHRYSEGDRIKFLEYARDRGSEGSVVKRARVLLSETESKSQANHKTTSKPH